MAKEDNNPNMTAAAQEAFAVLKQQVEQSRLAGETFSAAKLMSWWSEWFMKAGHNRLAIVALIAFGFPANDKWNLRSEVREIPNA